MKPPEEMSQVEMAAFVQTLLADLGIRVVLSGGAATAYYCQNRYLRQKFLQHASHDLEGRQ